MLPLIALPVASTGSPATKPVSKLSLDELLSRIEADYKLGKFENVTEDLVDLEGRDLNSFEQWRARRELKKLNITCNGWVTLGTCDY